jgi:hypothetical protein
VNFAEEDCQISLAHTRVVDKVLHFHALLVVWVMFGLLAGHVLLAL